MLFGHDDVVLRIDDGGPGMELRGRQPPADGLLRTPPDYSPPAPIADAGDTTVEVATAESDWTHRARDAPTGSTPPTCGRACCGSWPPPCPRRPSRTALWPPWPAPARVRLAGIGSCSVVDDPAVVRSLTTREETFYRQGGTTYDVAAAVLLPGDTCSA